MPAAWRARRAARRIRCSWASRPTWGACFDPASASVAPRELARVLTLRDLVLIVVGTTIGSGIFAVPGAVLRQSGGDLGVALLVWLLGSVLALLGALTFGELGAMLPDAGGSYVYVRDAFGPLPAFLLGWTLFLAINSGGTATLAVAFANYLGELVPLAPAAHKLAAVAMIAAVAAVNIRGVRQAASVQNWSTALKVGALLALAVAGVALGDGFHRSDARAFTTPLSFASFSAAGVALLGVLWAYEGWQNVTNSAGEARDPQRTFARGIGFGTAALVAIYTDGERRLRGGARRCRGGGDGPRGGRCRAHPVWLRRREARHARHSRVDFQRRQRDGAHGPPHVLRDGARPGVLPIARRRASPVRDAGPRGRLQRLVVDGARGERHVRAAVHVCGVRELDLRRARRSQRLRATPAPPGRPPAVPRPGLSRYAGAVHRRRGGDRRKYDRRPAGAGLDRPRDRGDGGARVLRVETQAEALEHVRSPRPTALPLSRRYSPRLTWSFPPMKTQGSNTDVVFLSGVRTGFGTFGGTLKYLSALELGPL